jgi:uncharacterized protein
MSASTVESLGGQQFVLLTTFRRDGRGVPTPVWVVRLDDGLAVWTAGRAGKVKRIRRDGSVTLAPCDRRGAPLGDAVPGSARILDEAGTERVRAAVRRKYGLLGRVLTALQGVRRRRSGSPVGIAITLA